MEIEDGCGGGPRTGEPFTAERVAVFHEGRDAAEGLENGVKLIALDGVAERQQDRPFETSDRRRGRHGRERRIFRSGSKRPSSTDNTQVRGELCFPAPKIDCSFFYSALLSAKHRPTNT